MERKLAAILAVDVVGYSALMERDEAGTFEQRNEYLYIFRGSRFEFSVVK